MGLLGLNIFTDAKSRMKHLILLFSLFFSMGLGAQVSIKADVSAGCIPLRVNFTILPLTAQDTITSAVWDFGNGLGSTVLSPSTLYDSAGVYTVSLTVNGIYNFVETDMITVIDCTDTLDIPNVFSPNEDNINDFFEVKTNGICSYGFSVFTRSGTLVYKTESPNIRWDGRSMSGQKMKNGIYFYIIRQLDGEPLNEFKGIVYLFE
jgi:gliding motility-associated-like protein